MTGSAPSVSILMPAYNAMPYLTEALDDLLAQTMGDFELVVVEDGSTDDTLATLRAYAARDGRLVILENEQNRGLVYSLNRGLERCRASLVARADADDRYAPDRLERQVAFMDAHPDVGLLSCAVTKMTEDGRPFATTRWPTEDAHIRLRELFENSFSHPGVMFRADLVRAVGGYDPAFESAEDCDLWARLRPHTHLANLPDPLVRYRVVSTSMMRTRGAVGPRLGLAVRQRLLSEYLGRPMSVDEARAISRLFKRRREPLPAGDIPIGLGGLREVLHRAQERETPDAVRYLRREGSRSLVWQAGLQRDRSPKVAGWLLAAALRYDPRPTTLVRVLRGALGALAVLLRPMRPSPAS